MRKEKKKRKKETRIKRPISPVHSSSAAKSSAAHRALHPRPALHQREQRGLATVARSFPNYHKELKETRFILSLQNNSTAKRDLICLALFGPNSDRKKEKEKEKEKKKRERSETALSLTLSPTLSPLSLSERVKAPSRVRLARLERVQVSYGHAFGSPSFSPFRLPISRLGRGS